MKTILALIAILALAGCTTTTEQTTMRGKEIVKLEKRGWNILGFFGELLEKVAIGTATNLASEHLRADPDRVGLRK